MRETVEYDLKNKLRIITVGSVLFGIFFVSYAWSGYLDFIPVIKEMRLGFNVFEGFPVYEQGRLWRLNSTFYEISTKGQTIYLNSTYPIANYSTCYDIHFRLSSSPYEIQFEISSLSGVTKTNCV